MTENLKEVLIKVRDALCRWPVSSLVESKHRAEAVKAIDAYLVTTEDARKNKMPCEPPCPPETRPCPCFPRSGRIMAPADPHPRVTTGETSPLKHPLVGCQVRLAFVPGGDAAWHDMHGRSAAWPIFAVCKDARDGMLLLASYADEEGLWVPVSSLLLVRVEGPAAP